MKTCAYCGKQSQDGATYCGECGTSEWLSVSASLPSSESTPARKPDPVRSWSTLFLGLAAAALALPASERLRAAAPWYVTLPVVFLVVFAYTRLAKRIPVAFCYSVGAGLWLSLSGTRGLPGDEQQNAEQNHWSERGRATSVSNADALGRPRRSVLSLGDHAHQAMQREISYEWSPELVRLGTRRFISRYAGRSLIAFVAVMILAIVALTVGRAEGFWWVVIILPIIYVSVWFGYYRRAVKICDEMPDRKVTVRIEPENITFQTSEHSTTMRWSRIKKLWRYPDVLLLFTYDQQTYSMLPVAPLGEDGRRFIEEKVREHGGQVT